MMSKYATRCNRAAARENARGKVGEPILVDKQYFENTLATIKSLVGRIEVQAKKITI